MSWSEPTTVVTDYLLAVAGAWLGWRLWRDGRRRGSRATRLLALALAAMALGAAAGGTAHGIVDLVTPAVHGGLWRATTAALGIAGFFLLCAALRAELAGRRARWATAAAAAKLALFLVWTHFDDAFVWVIVDYGTSMLVVAALMLARPSGERNRGAAGWLLAGIGVSAVGAVVQAARLAPHPLFNHNDLYHVIQLVALLAFYRGGRLLVDAAGARRR